MYEKGFVLVCSKEDNRDAPRFPLFKETPNAEQIMSEIRELQMNRVPFRTSAISLLFTATLMLHFPQMTDSYPVTAQRVEKCF